MKPRIVRDTWQFLAHDLWRIRARSLPRTRGFLIRLLRVVILAGRGFKDDKCQLRASALTFYSMLSIVPVVAMAFGISSGFPGLQSRLKEELRRMLPAPTVAAPADPGAEPAAESDSPAAGDASDHQVAEKIIDYSEKLLNRTSGGWIAGIGVLILFWTVIKVLGQIEGSFNDIWGIRKHRPIGRKLADYLTVILVGPVLLILSSSAAVAIQVEVQNIVKWLGLHAGVAKLVVSSLKILSWAVIWALFTFLYKFMPNTKVRFSSALIAGVVAGSVYQVVQWAYLAFQVGVAKYNEIYGSLAALPLFLVWLQLSWLVVLFGAEISFSWQNVDTFEFEPDCLKVSRSFKRLLSLWITQALVRTFDREEKPLTAEEISHNLEVPIRLVNEILYELVAAGIARETPVEETQETAFLVARPLERFTVKYVLD
ncbi:MAG: YihY/virulence factor BrkB family protein, partial [Planctomycetota bacterium]